MHESLFLRYFEFISKYTYIHCLKRITVCSYLLALTSQLEKLFQEKNVQNIVKIDGKLNPLLK